MSVFGFLHPKFKHPDPAVRAIAVARLTNQAQLADIAQTDESPDIQRIALERLTDEELRAAIARGPSPLNLLALEGITEPRLMAAIAETAQSAAVRAKAASRVTDVRILHRIAAHDIDPAIRLQARARLGERDGVQQHLRQLLVNLKPAALPPGDGTKCGGVDEVCTAVTRDGRFQIDAVVTEPSPAARKADGVDQAIPSPVPANGCIELLAHRRGGALVQPADPNVHYRIRICRLGDNSYAWSMTERRTELTNDVESWASSSNGTA